jgi:L-ornithine N5-oxygenase
MTQAIASPAVHDLIGIGFGPSNLALAIALQEREKTQGKLDVLFLDKQADYRWHGNTLVTMSELQISFLKDLVTLRNPTSPYSFVNYLKAHDRLVDFINLGTFYPCRMEFNDYLRWVAGQFQAQARYGEEVLAIEPILHQQQVEALRVISRDALGEQHVRTTRSVVVSAGGAEDSRRVQGPQGRQPGVPPFPLPRAHGHPAVRGRQGDAHRDHRRWPERGRGLHRPERQLPVGAGRHDPARFGAQACR